MSDEQPPKLPSLAASRKRRLAAERQLALLDRRQVACLLCMALTHMLGGDLDAGKQSLGEAIKCSGGYILLGEELDMSPKSLIRMFGPKGNPQAKNLFAILDHLQRRAGVTLTVERHRREA